ncbi:MAG: carbonic anhydrase/acetyltransferase-like protein (isoleucine patch superfamily), partial [Gammaproteobacteria bacterium]
GKTLEGGYLWVGSPVKQARALNDKERAFILHSAEHYVEIAKRTAAS